MRERIHTSVFEPDNAGLKGHETTVVRQLCGGPDRSRVRDDERSGGIEHVNLENAARLVARWADRDSRPNLVRSGEIPGAIAKYRDERDGKTVLARSDPDAVPRALGREPQ